MKLLVFGKKITEFGLTTDTTCIFESVCGLTFHFLGMLKNDPDSVNSVTMVTSIYLPHFRFWVYDQMMNGMNPESCTFITFPLREEVAWPFLHSHNQI